MSEYSDADRFFRQELFDIHDLQDEIRVDQLCGRFLRLFVRDLTETAGLPPAEAGALAHGADYFLREFVIPDRRENIFRLRPGRVRQFAGNWYIVRNVEPNMAELEGILLGVEAFYDFCLKLGKVGADLAATVRSECADLDFYRRRIESFWAIEGGGYEAWERECTLKEQD